MTLSSASSRGWGPGWPHCNRSNIITITKGGVSVPVHRAIAPIVAHLIDATERTCDYDVKPGQTWGFACRAIRGSSSPSNHSWGLAVDINAPTNPMGSRLITDMPRSMVNLWGAHMFDWGGNYRSRPDAMHYEFAGTPDDAARIVRQLKQGTAPAVVASAFPLRLKDPMMKNCLIAEYQQLVNKFNRKYHTYKVIKEDGAFGPESAAAASLFKTWVRKFQRDFGLAVWPDSNGAVGPLVFGTLQFWTANL